MTTKQESKLMAVGLTVLIILFVITASIAVPILVRPFYYAHIDALNLPETTGYTKEEIRTAFDEMMDYCMGKTDDFSTGKLAWSEEGKSHFYDCSLLFSLDLALMIFSAVWLIACCIFRFVGVQQAKYGGAPPTIERKRGGRAKVERFEGNKRYVPAKFKGKGPAFWSGAIMIILFALLGIMAAVDFDGFFVKFHHMFFPGKENWIFDPAKDEIINILPEVFFRNCAILIGSLIIIASIILMAASLIISKRAEDDETEQKNIETEQRVG